MENKRITKEIPREDIDRQYGYMQQVKAMLTAADENSAPKAHIRTYGCQQNEADSERIAGMAAEMGYTVTDDEAEADLIVVNTCAVREHAELKALSITGQFKHLKAKNPKLVIGVCGCMVSQEHRKEDIKNKYPYVDFLLGTTMLYRFPELLYETLRDGKRHFLLDTGDPGAIAEGLPVRRESSFKAWVSIMYGCNNFCTYCVVPYVRGRERSRKSEEILAEIRELAVEGYREITLLGQNVNSYGKDLDDGCDFADLLDEICKIPGDFIIRFMTSHPKDASKKLIDVMAKNEKIAKQFHLPLQSGSDNVLRVMNRRYTRDSYFALTEYMREKMPDIALSTDIIVGFPGETEEDFAGTLDMLERVKYDNIYSFIYSKRKGTPAAEMENQIPDEVKSERFARLLETQNRISKEKNSEFVGKTIEVLVEGRSKTDESKLTGRTELNRLVHFTGDDELIGRKVNVLIESAEIHALFGKTV